MLSESGLWINSAVLLFLLLVLDFLRSENRRSGTRSLKPMRAVA
jgi:hypothetical protein